MLVEHGLQGHERPFPDAALRCLPVVPPGTPWEAAPEEAAKRRDLRTSRLVCSVDPPGCQDIDDALSVEALPDGGWEVGVHIADVTQFVKAGSALDVEAAYRATTVYLVDRRLDMLPELLSSTLCSLRSHVDRYTMSVLWRFDKDLNLLPQHTWFGRAVVRSAAALSYGQVIAPLLGTGIICVTHSRRFGGVFI